MESGSVVIDEHPLKLSLSKFGQAWKKIKESNFNEKRSSNNNVKFLQEVRCSVIMPNLSSHHMLLNVSTIRDK